MEASERLLRDLLRLLRDVDDCRHCIPRDANTLLRKLDRQRAAAKLKPN